MAGLRATVRSGSQLAATVRKQLRSPKVHAPATLDAGGLAFTARAGKGGRARAALDSGGTTLTATARKVARAGNVDFDCGGLDLVATGRAHKRVRGSVDSGGLALTARARAHVRAQGALDCGGAVLTARAHAVIRLWRKSLTIDHTKVGSGPHTNFQVAVILASDSDLVTYANTDGSDIVLTDDTGAVLKFEITKFVHATGELVAWVKVPSLSSSVDTTLYLYFGAGTTTDNKADPTGVWSSEYLFVGHLDDTPPDVTRFITGLQPIGEKIILTGGYLYYISASTNVVKIDASTFTVTATLTAALSAGGETMTTDGSFLYVGVTSFPGKIDKIRLSDFTVVGTLTLPSGEDGPAGLHIVGTNLYVSLGGNSPGKVVKIDLNTFTRTAALTLNSGENIADESADDGAYLYVPTESGQIVRISLASFTRVDAVSLSGGPTDVQQTLVYNGYVYAVCRNGVNSHNDGTIARVPTSNFTSGAIEYLTTVKSSNEAFQVGSVLYVASYDTFEPAVAKIDLTTFTELGRIYLPESGRGEGIWVDSSYVYFLQDTADSLTGRVTRIDLAAFSMTSAQLYAKDSTANANRGIYAGAIPAAAQVAAQVCGGLSLDGVNDYLELGQGVGLKITTSFTLSGWFYRPASLPAEAGLIVRRIRADSGGATINYQLAWDTSGLQFNAASNTLTYSTAIAVGWHKVEAVWDNAAQTRTIFLDGVSVANNATAGSLATSGTMHVNIGNKPGYLTTWNGKMDEIRIIAALRSAAWIATEYANQNSPSTFFSVGARQAAP